MNKQKETFLWVQRDVSLSLKRLLLEFKETTFRVERDYFSKVATRLSRPAEPSQQLCRLQSAGLPSLVTTPFNRTTTTLIVVQPYTL